MSEEDPERDRATPGVEDLFRRAAFLRKTHPEEEEEEEEEGGGGRFIQS